jgi:hypothetical protein
MEKKIIPFGGSSLLQEKEISKEDSYNILAIGVLDMESTFKDKSF